MTTMPAVPTARAAWPRSWPAGLAWALWTLALLGLAATVRLDQLLIQAGLPALTAVLSQGNLTSAVAAVSAATVGAVVASRRPDHRVGWLVVALGLSLVASGFAFSYTRYGLVARPGALLAADYLAGFANGAVFLYLSLAGWILLLTPTGRLPSTRWRWWARVQVAALVVAFLSSALNPTPLYPEYPEIGNPLGVEALGDGPLTTVFPVGALLLLTGLPVGAVSLLLRFRRARGLERLQLRWLAVGAALAAVALVVSLTALVIESSDGVVFQAALGICVMVLPLATGAAILRYRLYDLDRIISRTLAYGLLTVLLGAGYAAVVLGLGQLLGRGRGHPGRGRGVPAGPPPHPGPCRPPLQPAPPRRRPDHRRVQHPPARPGRPSHPHRRAAGRGRPNRGTDHGVALAATPRTIHGTRRYGSTTRGNELNAILPSDRSSEAIIATFDAKE
jgi:hypothetical protein